MLFCFCCFLMRRVFNHDKVVGFLDDLSSFLIRIGDLQNSLVVVDERVRSVEKRFSSGEISEEEFKLVLASLRSERKSLEVELGFVVDEGVRVLKELEEYVKLQKF